MRCRLAAIAGAGGALVMIAACQSNPNRPPQDLSGAPTPRGAVERFLAAVRSQDLQALALVWGSKKGPARETLPRQDMEKQEVILVNCLANDSASFLDENGAPEGERQVRFVLYHGTISRTRVFTTASGPLSRWYVQEIDLRDTHACTVESNGGPPRR
jgi:hypothetical protein